MAVVDPRWRLDSSGLVELEQFQDPYSDVVRGFDASRFEITSVGISVGIGVQWAMFHFTSFGNDAPVPDDGIQVGGGTAAGIGAGASMIFGSMYPNGHPRETMRVPVYAPSDL
jgi:hypothetical protein